MSTDTLSAVMPPDIGHKIPIRKRLWPTWTTLALALEAMGLISVTLFLIFKYNFERLRGRKKIKEKGFEGKNKSLFI